MEPSAVIFTGPNFLSFNLVNNLLSKHCSVTIVTKQKEDWKKFLRGKTTLLKIVDLKDFSLGHADYCFVVEGIDIKNAQLGLREKEKIFGFIKSADPKSVVILPYITLGGVEKTSGEIVDFFLQNNSSNMNLVYAGEMYGVGMSFSSGGFVSHTFSGLLSGKIDVPSYDFICFPLNVNSFTEYLVRGVFSYGFQKRRFVVAEKMSVYGFLRRLQKIAPWVIFERNVAFKKPTNALVFDFESVGVSEESIAETVDWVKTLSKDQTVSTKAKSFDQEKLKAKIKKISSRVKIPSFPVKEKIRQSRLFRKKVLVICLVVFLWGLSLPFFSLFASGVSMRQAYRSFLGVETQKGVKFLDVAGFFSGFARGQLSVLSKVPLAGRIFKLPYKVSLVLQETIGIGKTGLTVYEDLKQLGEGVVSDKDYDLVSISQRTFLTLDTIYKDSSFLDAEIDEIWPLAVSVFPQIKSVDTFREYILALGGVVRRLPVLLGSQTKKTYLVLFQNNMELRPTGGFIGSFALVTFDHGKLVDTSVFDVYEADGQLKGHVEPPGPIKNYLGEANWYLRDSNWDPDFKTSALRAEWFLEKEFDRQVDGVIGIDLQVVKEILKQTGPLELSDTNITVDYKNMYEKIQHEVESNFFPGSQKKSTILTSLGKAILGKLPDLTSDPSFGLSVASLLRGKHIQVYLHDKDSQDALGSVNFDGRVEPDDCGTNCLNLWFGVVEANLGVNKVNYYVQRNLSFTADVKPTNIDNQLTVKIANTATSEALLAGSYKNYIRILAPPKSYFDKVVSVGADGTKDITPDVVQVGGHIEAGVLVNIAPGEIKTLVFSWNLASRPDFSKEGMVQFYLRKQAGIETVPVSIKIKLPENKFYFLDPKSDLTLTGGHEVEYNTDLTTDLVGRVFWK